jgi:hypothetical protein
MPIDYRIDHEKRLVLACSFGKLTDDEILAYQQDVWSRIDVAGYNEMVDLTAVEEFDTLSASKMREIAALGASLDLKDETAKTAMIASPGLNYGISRMYEVFRQLEPATTRTVRTFVSREEALRWLGVDDDET